ncbi:hypothetical protein KQY15_15545 [Rheinheimera sp. SM2107]|uniref:Uncharacterized protein n=2 Tax=Arsukibacterium indicum TaxID=2848612 RepID=A0ABS6MNY6_9GAMM|nr:hypothetical protein [Arsukibacterium indicum]
MNEITLLNTVAARTSYRHLADEQLDDAANKLVQYFTGDKLLIIYRISKGKLYDTENQLELPLTALPWLKDTIINGFWRQPSAGGLPKDQHSVAATFSGEEILLGRSMNAGDYAKPGFKIVNKSRKSHIMASRPQEFQITDERVESVLLPLLSQLGIT